MCTVVLLTRPDTDWPLLLAANRDERLDRGWDAPARHWPDQPGVLAGRDHSAGGTWLGVNDRGVVAAVLNRVGTLGPAPGKASRGALPLLALQEASARVAATRIAALDGRDYRPFNLVLADREAAFFLRGIGDATIGALVLPPGLHMATAQDIDDPASPRTHRHLPRFAAASVPAPPNWSVWASLLADQSGEAAAQLNVAPHDGFGTSCASLIGVSAGGATPFLFADGPPDRAEFRPVS